VCRGGENDKRIKTAMRMNELGGKIIILKKRGDEKSLEERLSFVLKARAREKGIAEIDGNKEDLLPIRGTGGSGTKLSCAGERKADGGGGK